MSQFVAINVSKGKGASSGLTAHNERTTTPPNANQSLSHLNVIDDFSHLGSTLEERALNVIGKSAITRKVQADAVLYSPLLFSGSHETLTKIMEEGRLNEWEEMNRKFIENKFGKENIISFALHADEATPHIHCSIVPIVRDQDKKGNARERLSARDLFSPDALKRLHDEYAEAMKVFGLSRGQDTSKSKVHHQTTAQYYRDLPEKIAEKQKELDELKPSPVGAVVGFLTSPLEKNARENKTLKGEIDDLKADLLKAKQSNELIKKDAQINVKMALERIQEHEAKLSRWFPIEEMRKIEKECKGIKLPETQIDSLIRDRSLSYSGALFSPGHKREVEVSQVRFEIKENKLFANGGTLAKMFDWFVGLFNQKEAKKLEEQRQAEEKANKGILPEALKMKSQLTPEEWAKFTEHLRTDTPQEPRKNPTQEPRKGRDFGIS